MTDASALLALLLGARRGRAVSGLVAARQSAGAAILVPGHFWLEVLNVLTRGAGLSGAAVIEALHDLDQIGLETRDVGREWVVPVLDLVERHRLTAYDAAYLVLAETTDAELLTADRELARAAGERAIFLDPRGQIAEPPAAYGITPTWPAWRGAAAYLGELRRRALDEQTVASG